MSKLVVCCDGTWNDPDERRGGKLSPTNVAKLALGLDTGGDQLRFYEAGVGTPADEHLIGGGLGYGLSRNVRNAYRFLVESYEEADDGLSGDDIYLFGFSRGAYTARSVAGFIRNCGILRKEHADRVEEAFALYKDRTSATHPKEITPRIFRESYAHKRDGIKFIGVWDTVGALGIPSNAPGWEELSKVFTGWEQLWGFHDTQLSSHVENAFHALSIDEKREPFQPTLWTGNPTAGQTLDQVWFSGVHSEVGGGTGDSDLSDIALLWMVRNAVACGLKFKDGWLVKDGTWDDEPPDGVPRVVNPNSLGPIDDSFKGWWTFLHRPYHRLVQPHVKDAPGQKVASSAERRFNTATAQYRPPGLEDYLQSMAPATPVVDETSRAGAR